MIVGIAGPAGAGKDTVADYLASHHRFVKLSFAGPLKAMLAAAGLGEPADRDMKEQLIKGFDFTWRQAAQTLGTEWGRNLDPSIWTKIVDKQIAACMERFQYVVLSDVRFENEGELIRSHGGFIIHLIGRRADLGDAASHKSENGVLFHPDRDEIVENIGDIAQLEALVDRAVWSRI